MAFPISVVSTFLSVGLLRASLSFGSWTFPARVYFIPGWVGAIIVLGGSLVAFVPEAKRSAFGRVLLWSIGGGALGVLQENAMTASYFEHAYLFDPQQTEILMLWPTGVALLLGALLYFERRPQRP
jgi:hypothetical protein